MKVHSVACRITDASRSSEIEFGHVIEDGG